MDKLIFIILSMLLVHSYGYPAEDLTSLAQSDDFFEANGVDGDPISSEQAEQYKQQLLQQKKEQEESIQQTSTSKIKIEEKEVIDLQSSTTDLAIEKSSDEPISSTSTTTTSTSTVSTTPFSETTTKASRPQGMFSRLIDDIFHIPIAVLQSVGRLLRNPFAPRRTPESPPSTY